MSRAGVKRSWQKHGKPPNPRNFIIIPPLKGVLKWRDRTDFGLPLPNPLKPPKVQLELLETSLEALSGLKLRLLMGQLSTKSCRKGPHK
jgi:hypothetical protein